ncbi:MAG: uroporphyrinogen decarboxylase [Armatimonadetes bacterium]|nr:uroporphyrinogen decarboxylase [Armatimonadota bacterium]MDW8122540.1 uroporphyrinogen decarboxylase [Armatimonadota bacterium]
MKDRLVRACRRQATDKTPIWLMRQAGRYLPEYRSLRSRYSLKELWSEPELACQVTLFPLKRFEVDGLIVFADLMTPLEEIGVALEIRDGVGPVVENPIRTPAQVAAFPHCSESGLGSRVAQTIKMVKAQAPDIPVIGFAGAPFTIAAYLIEGGPSRDFSLTRSFLYSDPSSAHCLMEKLTDLVLNYLADQVKEGGADLVQVFDSWVGVLSPDDYTEFVLPYTKRLLEQVASWGVPVIHFGTGTASLLKLMKEAGGDVIGVDWRVDIGWAWDQIGHDRGIQGNLDPAALLGPEDTLKEKVLTILKRTEKRAGHIFNLGHGVLPQTNPDQVAFLVDLVHELTENPVCYQEVWKGGQGE